MRALNEQLAEPLVLERVTSTRLDGGRTGIIFAFREPERGGPKTPALIVDKNEVSGLHWYSGSGMWKLVAKGDPDYMRGFMDSLMEQAL